MTSHNTPPPTLFFPLFALPFPLPSDLCGGCSVCNGWTHDQSRPCFTCFGVLVLQRVFVLFYCFLVECVGLLQNEAAGERILLVEDNDVNIKVRFGNTKKNCCCIMLLPMRVLGKACVCMQ